MASLFNKSLSAMVKGIRNNKDDESEYIAKCIGEIKSELRENYPDIKTMAVRKLVYLQLLGYDISWASFHIIEVMNLPWLGYRRVGYLAAALCFTDQTDVILLTTHLFRKGFTQSTISSNPAMTEGLKYETGAALSCFAGIVTADLAQDLLSEIYGMMNSSQPYIRKKAVLVLLKVFLKWPKALRLSFDRLKEKLDDENQGVVSAAVYVICELATKSPQNYLALAPHFFKILTTSSNNWVLIKVVKLLSSLVPLEPRLAKKLVEPLTNILSTTPAKSLHYECVNTLLSGTITSKVTVRLCLDSLTSFIGDADQNLKYLGLLGLHKLMQQHPRVVAEQKDVILVCLNDEDITIRKRALDLITSMVSKTNLQGIVARLVQHLATSDGTYRTHVLDRLLFICSQQNFAFIEDFEWYIQTLVDLTATPGVSKENSELLNEQLLDVLLRVPEVRGFAVGALAELIQEGTLMNECLTNHMSLVLYASAWTVGEYAEMLTNEHAALLKAMTAPNATLLPEPVQNVLIQNILKVFISVLLLPHVGGPVFKKGGDDEDDAEEGDDEEDEETTAREPMEMRDWYALVDETARTVKAGLGLFVRSPFVEVQERAVVNCALVEWLCLPGQLAASTCTQPLGYLHASASAKEKNEKKKKSSSSDEEEEEDEEVEEVGNDNEDLLSHPGLAEQVKISAEVIAECVGSFNAKIVDGILDQLSTLSEEVLNPVNARAQKKVPLPDGLDLNAWINEPSAQLSESEKSASEEESSEEEEASDGSSSDDDKKKKKKDKYGEMPKNKRGSTSGGKMSAKEISAAKEKRERMEENKKKDPFYIGSTKAAVVDVSKIPIRKLSLDDLPAIEVDGEKTKKDKRKKEKEREKEKKSKPVKSYKINTGTDLPEGVELSSEEEETTKKGGKSKVKRAEGSDEDDTVDLETPLGEDELMPRVLTYAEQEKAKKKAAQEKEDAKKDKKKKKDQEKDKDEKKSKDDKKDKKKKKDKEKDKDEGSGPSSPKTVSPAPAAPAASFNILDMFDPIANEGGSSSSSSAAASMQSPSTPTPTYSDMGSPAAYEDVSDVPARTRKSSAARKADKKGGIGFGTLLSDEANGLTITYSMKRGKCKTETDDPFILVLFSVSYIPGDSGRVEDLPSKLKELSITVAHTPTLGSNGATGGEEGDEGDEKERKKKHKSKDKDKGEKSSKQKIKFKSVKAGKSMDQCIQLDMLGPITAPTVLQCTISYAALTGGEDDKDVKQTVPMQVPVSLFLSPVKISPADFKLVVSPHTTTATITLAVIPVADALKLVCNTLNVRLVQAVSFVASYYALVSAPSASSASPVHLCVQIKGSKSGEPTLGVSVMSNNSEVMAAIMTELKAVLH